MADEMDRALDADRRLRGGRKKTYSADLVDLPDGTFVARDDASWLLRDGRLLRWTHAGYTASRPAGSGSFEVLTPWHTTEVLRAGYEPRVHASAAG